jgi:hypothetical protein
VKRRLLHPFNLAAALSLLLCVGHGGAVGAERLAL